MLYIASQKQATVSLLVRCRKFPKSPLPRASTDFPLRGYYMHSVLLLCPRVWMQGTALGMSAYSFVCLSRPLARVRSDTLITILRSPNRGQSKTIEKQLPPIEVGPTALA